MDSNPTEQLVIVRDALEEKQRAIEMQKDAKRKERRAGIFMAIMLQDLRSKLGTRREQAILNREQRWLRVKSKWASLVWRGPSV